MMVLPKLVRPIFEVENPADQTKIKMRPMELREEKVLLMAKQSEVFKEKVDAATQILAACTVEGALDSASLPFYALEYLFIKLRAASVSHKAKASYKDEDEETSRIFDIDLNEVKLIKNSQISDRIALSDTVTIKLAHPSASFYTSEEIKEIKDEDMLTTLLENCIKEVYSGDAVIPLTDVPKEEVAEFVNSIPASKYEALQNFFAATPRLSYVIEYKNVKEVDRRIELSSFDDFFTFV